MVDAERQELMADNDSKPTADKPMVPEGREQDVIDALTETTSMPCFLLAIDDDTAPTLTCSKIGGLPYWPNGVPFPVADPRGLAEDEGFALLAQLDLADFGGDSRLPDHGLLQFFLTQDDVMGLFFDEPNDTQKHFRVVWHEDIDPSVTEESVRAQGILASDPDGYFPIQGEHVLRVRSVEQDITPSDVRFDAAFKQVCTRLFGEGYDDPKRSWADYLTDDQLTEVSKLDDGDGSQHRVLGYPFFTQYDPRNEKDAETYDTLLLQLDTDFDASSRVDWGDCGVGNFFINGEALASGDFSHVLFNWDCY